ncbi:zinc-binding dehydrogenase [Ancylobacter dichloromethanicus]|uniref:NADPH:quinone reductase n=1 Tax=Ancylobacter dichloromethanicus TaxID=518825 RepID=A0A9W6J679_9HYPH|nr:zinc-binding dehydrogenase [Ancylobacter dichloromethanicus]MBS7555932.1 zinc-binding dehydrogenase [Ancylobacter dichloromethanicus]GLK70154.1 NADPH:quinone reductase [Ancylobacter dichloromethanicus]
MRAIQATQFGSPSVLTVVDLPDPTPGPGQIAIDVTHAAVGLIDLLFRQGQFKDVPGMAQPPLIPGLEVAGTVRALGDGVTGFAIGENVVSMSAGAGTGGYASVYIAPVHGVVSIEGSNVDPALVVAMIPNAAMAHVALSLVAKLGKGESVLVHGALGGFSSAFPGIARQLGASRVVGTVRSGKLETAAHTKLPYDRIVDSSELPGVLEGEKFDVIIDPVGGAVRGQSFALMKPGSRLIVAGNASGDWAHSVKTNDLWLGSTTVAGFNAGALLPLHPQALRRGLEAALKAVAAGLCDIPVDVLPFSEAVTAHERMESRDLCGRIVLTPEL